MRIIELAQVGVRPSDISRQLRVSHGCVSKILCRYQETGSIEPGTLVSSNKPRDITSEIKQKIDEYCTENPGVFSCEVRERLIRDKICDRLTVPSLGDISQVLKARIAKENDDVAGIKNGSKKRFSTSTTASTSSCSDDEKDWEEHDGKRKRSASFEGSHSIYNILKHPPEEKGTEKKKEEDNEDDDDVKIKVEGDDNLTKISFSTFLS